MEGSIEDIQGWTLGSYEYEYSTYANCSFTVGTVSFYFQNAFTAHFLQVGNSISLSLHQLFTWYGRGSTMRVLLIVECSQIDQNWFYLYIIIWKSQKRDTKPRRRASNIQRSNTQSSVRFTTNCQMLILKQHTYSLNYCNRANGNCIEFLSLEKPQSL